MERIRGTVRLEGSKPVCRYSTLSVSDIITAGSRALSTKVSQSSDRNGFMNSSSDDRIVIKTFLAKSGKRVGSSKFVVTWPARMT